MESHAWLVNVARGATSSPTTWSTALRERGDRRRRPRRHRPRAAARRATRCGRCRTASSRPHVGNTPEMAEPLLAERITPERAPVRARRGADRARSIPSSAIDRRAPQLDGGRPGRAAGRRRPADGGRRADPRCAAPSTRSSPPPALDGPPGRRRPLTRLVDGRLGGAGRRRRAAPARRGLRRGGAGGGGLERSAPTRRSMPTCSAESAKVLRAFVRDGRLQSIPTDALEAAGRPRPAGPGVRAGAALQRADGEPDARAAGTPTPRRCGGTSSTRASSIGPAAVLARRRHGARGGPVGSAMPATHYQQLGVAPTRHRPDEIRGPPTGASRPAHHPDDRRRTPDRRPAMAAGQPGLVRAVGSRPAGDLRRHAAGAPVGPSVPSASAWPAEGPGDLDDADGFVPIRHPLARFGIPLPWLVVLAGSGRDLRVHGVRRAAEGRWRRRHVPTACSKWARASRWRPSAPWWRRAATRPTRAGWWPSRRAGCTATTGPRPTPTASLAPGGVRSPGVARALARVSCRRAISSVGRAPRSHRGGHGIEARIAHLEGAGRLSVHDAAWLLPLARPPGHLHADAAEPAGHEVAGIASGAPSSSRESLWKHRLRRSIGIVPVLAGDGQSGRVRLFAGNVHLVKPVRDRQKLRLIR